MKFKTIKQSSKQAKPGKHHKGESREFPKIFRFITENKSLRQILASIGKSLTYLNSNPKLKRLTVTAYALFLILLIFAIFAGIVSFYNNLPNFRRLSLKKQEITANIKLWKSIAEKYPGYKDAYFKIASMEYQIGDYGEAKTNVEKALVLDPNFKDAITLKKIIDLNY